MDLKVAAATTNTAAVSTRRSVAKIVGASLAALSLTFMHAAPAAAGSATGVISIVGSVLSTCTVGSATLTFGAYTPGGAAVTGSTSIQAFCTLATPATIAMDAGQNHANALSGSTRAMKNGATAYYLSYDLYQDAGDTTLWNATTGTLAYTGTGVPTTVNVYAKIPGSQTNITSGSGTYTDSVTATISY